MHAPSPPLLAAFIALALAGPAAAQDTTSDAGKLSYALGYSTGNEILGMRARGEQVDVATFIKALQDATAGREPAVPIEQLQAAAQDMQRREMARAKAEFQKLAARNKAASDELLARHRTMPGVQVLPSGVQYSILEAGSGPRPTASSEVQVQYRTSLSDSEVVADTARAPGAQSGAQTLRISEVELPGMREALLAMPAGSHWEVVVPGNLAAGTGQNAGRFVNQAMVIDLRLISVKP